MNRKIPTSVILLIIILSMFSLDLTRRYLSGDFDDDKLEIELLYSSEKAGWLASVVDDFEKEWSDLNGKQIRVIINAIGSGKGTNQVATEASKPTIWSPASRFWLPILNLLWKTNHDNNIVQVNAPSLVVSPTIIATWKSFQESNNIRGLEDLRQLAITDSSFTFAHTDPFESNSGFGAVIMQASVAAGKSPDDLTLEDLALDSVQEWMRDLEGAAIQYGSSTGFLAKLMANEGPSHLKAAVIYENLVIEKNKELSGEKLVAVYPVEGTLLNDHPYAILDAPWVSEQDKILAEDFLVFLRTAEIQEKAIDLGFRPSIETGISPSKIQEVFTEEAGVIPSLDGINIYDIGAIEGKILERIPDLWTATRSRSLGSDSGNAQNLVAQDFIVPIIILTVYLSMILTPIISKFRRVYF